MYEDNLLIQKIQGRLDAANGDIAELYKKQEQAEKTESAAFAALAVYKSQWDVALFEEKNGNKEAVKTRDKVADRIQDAENKIYAPESNTKNSELIAGEISEKLALVQKAEADLYTARYYASEIEWASACRDYAQASANMKVIGARIDAAKQVRQDARQDAKLHGVSLPGGDFFGSDEKKLRDIAAMIERDKKALLELE